MFCQIGVRWFILKVWHVRVKKNKERKKWTRHNQHQNVQLFNTLNKCSASLWECECFYSKSRLFFSFFFSFHFSASFCWQMTFNHLHPYSQFLEGRKIVILYREWDAPFSKHLLYTLKSPAALLAPACALCTVEWSPRLGVASWGEPVKHLLWALQLCIMLASTEPLMLGL